MSKLHQIIAIDKSNKSKYHEAITASHHLLQKTDPFHGIARQYRPKDDEGEKLPNEDKAVIHRASKVILDTTAKLTEALNIEATRDYANCEAKASIEVDGKVIAENVPVTFLLALEKKLIDVKTFIQKLPTLPAGEEWVKNDTQDLWSTKPVESTRTKKISKPLELSPATKEHPAQVKEITEDVIVGYWSTTKYSSALPVSEINAMLNRVEKLMHAVKFARTKANETEAKKIEVGKPLFDFVFAL